MEWASHLGSRRVGHKAIKAYLTGLRSAHIDMGYPNADIFASPQLQRVVRGIHRLNGDGERKERLPITRGILLRLLRLLRHFDQTQLSGATIHAAFCLAFAGFLRAGEFTYGHSDLHRDFAKWHLTRRNVRLYKDHIELSIPSSKTDPFRRGITLTIAAGSDEACPLRSLTNLLTRFPSPRGAPLFFTGPTPFTRELVVEALRWTLRQCGIQGHYSGHSFRRGAATSARESGVSDDMIQILGRWKSDAYKLYIDTNKSTILEAIRVHQRTSPIEPPLS